MNLRIKIFLLLTFFSISNLWSQSNKPAYQIYTPKGKKVSYKKMIKQIKDTEVILFGEFHNLSLAHWLQLEVLQDLSKYSDKCITVGLEMLEADYQLVLNDYLNDKINNETYLEQMELWSNYDTDYAPVVEFAKENSYPVIATNVPRRYASRLFKEGESFLEDLTAEEKAWIAPLPFPFDASLPGYQKMLEMMGGGHDGESLNFPKAQAIKDATMAHFIIQHLPKNGLFYHLNGAFHSDYFDGINWYIKQYRPNTKIKTLTTVLQKDISSLEEEFLNAANFIIAIPETMTKTY